MSYNREHCVMFDPTVWTQEDVLGSALADFLNSMFPPPDYSLLENSHLQFNENGPVFSGVNQPRRYSDFEDGFTIEFWFNLQSKPTGAYTMQLFQATNADGSAELEYDNLEAKLSVNHFLTTAQLTFGTL
jgi:hypothetical protein